WHAARRAAATACISGTAVLNAAIGVAGQFHFELELEVSGLSAGPRTVDRARWIVSRGLRHQRAIDDGPELRIAIPVGHRLAVEDLRPTVVILEVERKWLAESAASSSPGRGGLPLRGRALRRRALRRCSLIERARVHRRQDTDGRRSDRHGERQ